MLISPTRRAVYALSLTLLATPAIAVETLTLQQAELLAEQHDPASERYQASAAAWQSQSEADAQLPDPKLRFGLQSVPTDGFDLEQEPMTQAQIGLVQEFPRGDTLDLKRRRNHAMVGVELARLEEQRRKRDQQVRDAYLELWYQQSAIRLLEQTRSVFSQLVEITRSQYAAGRDAQQDVLRARLELTLLEDRLTKVRNEAVRAEVGLRRWVGEEAVMMLSRELPTLPDIPAHPLERLSLHPLLQIDNANVQVSEADVALADAAYSPGFALDIAYGKRFGENADGSDRADLASVMISMDLPIFTNKRQDQRFAASQTRLHAARFERDDRLLELKRQLATAQSNYAALLEREARYRDEAVPQAQQTARATRNAYQSRVTEFTNVVRASVTELDSRLQLFRIQADRARSHANLIYLLGE